MVDDFRGRGGSPWGSPPGGGSGNGSGRRGPTPPNIDELIKKLQDKINVISYLNRQQTIYEIQKSEIGIKFNDKDLNIKWPIKNPILSKKDRNNLSFQDFKKKFKLNLDSLALSKGNA